MSSDERRVTVRRLQNAEGRLRAIDVLIEADASCGQLLHQLWALKVELRSLKIQLLKCQIHTSENIIRQDPCIDHRITEFQRLRDLYLHLIKMQLL